MGELVKVLDREVERLEYRGAVVLTLRQVDELHARPEGTARKCFNRHKEKLMYGVDYFAVPCEEWRELVVHLMDDQKGGHKGRVYFLTETGYLMVTKPFTDDRAWQVQRLLVNTYFKARTGAPQDQGVAAALRAIEARLGALERPTRPAPQLPGEQSVEALIWEMPPLYHRLYAYLKRRAGRTGSMTTTLRQLAEGIAFRQWGVEKVPNKKVVSDILVWLQAQGIAEVVNTSQGTTISLMQRRKS